MLLESRIFKGEKNVRGMLMEIFNRGSLKLTIGGRKLFLWEIDVIYIYIIVRNSWF